MRVVRHAVLCPGYEAVDSQTMAVLHSQQMTPLKLNSFEGVTCSVRDRAVFGDDMVSKCVTFASSSARGSAYRKQLSWLRFSRADVLMDFDRSVSRLQLDDLSPFSTSTELCEVLCFLASLFSQIATVCRQ